MFPKGTHLMPPTLRTFFSNSIVILDLFLTLNPVLMWFSFIFLFPSKGNFHVWKVFCNGQSHKDAFRNILHNGVLLLMTFPKIYKNRGTEYSVQNYTFQEPKSPVWRTQPFTVAIRSLLQPNLFGGSGLCAHRRVPRAALECGCWAPGSRLPFADVSSPPNGFVVATPLPL